MWLPPTLYLDIGGLIIVIIIAIGIARNVRTGELHFGVGSYVRALMQKSKGAITGSDFFRILLSVLFIDVTTTRVLKTCHRVKWVSHLLIFWGFVSAAIATILAFVMKPEGVILPLIHPVKIFGNLGGILLVAGTVAMFFIRYQESGSLWHLNASDFFLITLFLTTVSGFATQQAIYTFGRDGFTTGVFYWIHIALIILLFVTAPFSKFMHSLYKPTWIVYDNIEKKLMSILEGKTPESER